MTISEQIDRGLDFFKDVKQTTIDNISETTEQFKNSLSEASDRAITKSIEGTAQITDNVNAITSKALENAIDYTIKSWLKEHPIFLWLVSHPILALIILLLLLFFIIGLFDAVITLIKSIWLFIFKIPQKLIKKTTNITIKTCKNISYKIWYKKSNQNKLELTNIYTKSDRRQRIAEILNRLEQLKQEQDRLLAEIAETIDIEENTPLK